MPYELVEAAYNCKEAERASLTATWNALEDFRNGENALAVADGSDSMCWGRKPWPAAVTQLLAIYFAERNTRCLLQPLHHLSYDAPTG